MRLGGLLLVWLVIHTGVVLAQVRVKRDVDYAGTGLRANTLNIYYKPDAKPQDVMVFIHGGSWNSGKKETYWWLGRNLAKRETVAVLINYPLAPEATFETMATACATALSWVKANIAAYGGNPNRIFVMGHSAGGHLAELINADPRYFDALQLENPIKGVILNDAFGLDMEEFLTKTAKDDNYYNFIRTFSTDTETWRLGSPIFYVEHIKNPHLLFYGGQTYEAIQLQTTRFHELLKRQTTPVAMEQIPGKSHVRMVSQLIFNKNPVYDRIKLFLYDTP